MKYHIKKMKKVFSTGILVAVCLSLSACYMGFAPKSDTCTRDPQDTTVKRCKTD